MSKEQMRISSEQFQKISSMLQSQGLSQNEIDTILNGEYSTFQNEHDLTNLFGADGNYQNVLRGLADGYTMDELPQIGVKQSEIQDFLGMLDKCNLSVENAKAINQYSNGSNMILSIKKGTSTREEIQRGIKTDTFEKLMERGMSKEQIHEVQEFIDTLDLDKPVHDNYDAIKEYAGKMGVQKSCYPSICSEVRDLNRLKHIDSTIESLDDGLSKARLPESMKLYRAIKTNGQRQPEDYLGKSMSNNGYTSTSPLYDSSFAKYDDYDTVMEIYAPKGTQGSYMTQLSDYDSVEQEVLLNPNDIYVMDAQKGVIDQNGRTKTVVKGLLLSKERECYRGIDKQEPSISSEKHTGQQYESSMDNPNIQSNLPTTQSRFSRVFSKMRAKFNKNNKINNADSRPTQSKTKTQEKKSWELEPEEKTRIQKETAEIAKRHREQQEEQVPQQEFGKNQTSMQNNSQEVNPQQAVQNQMQQQMPPPPTMPDMGGMEL